MAKIVQRPTAAEEEFLKNIEEGVFDDRVETFMPPETYGPPSPAELAAASRKRTKSTNGAPANGRHGRSELAPSKKRR